MTNSNVRLITILLDRSGSMLPVKKDTEGGLRAFLDTQKEAPGQTLVTLRQFDHEHDTVFENVPLADVPPVELHPRGGTALLDAIGSTIASVGEHLAALPEYVRPGEVVLVILTDGHENSSKEWTLEAVKDTITHQHERYGWQFVYLGANQDAITVGRGMGISPDSSLSYGSHNTAHTMAVAGEAVTRGSRTGNYGFTDDERDEATS